MSLNKEYNLLRSLIQPGTEVALVILRGLPGSGKTTLAKNALHGTDTTLVSRDDLRDLLFNKRVVELAIKQDLYRASPVGEAVIRNMALKYLSKGYLPILPLVDKKQIVTPYVADITKPKCVIVDLDGTVACANGRGWYDYDLVGNDFARVLIVRLVNLLYEDGYVVIFLSGRSEDSRKVTWNWLRKAFNTITRDQSTELHMRKAGDSRADNIAKYELFDEFIRDRFNVEYVLDDRDSVIKMWRALGLNTLQVADGAF